MNKSYLLAEQMVIVDLLRNGYYGYTTLEKMPYDVVGDFDGELKRIQVKSTEHKRKKTRGHSPEYMFGLHNSLWPGQCDIIAFVALDIRDISYHFPHEFSSNQNAVIYFGEDDGKYANSQKQRSLAELVELL